MRVNGLLASAAGVAFALMLAGVPIYPSGGSIQPQAASLLERANKLTNIWAKDSPGFVLDAHITIYGRAGTSEAGIYHAIWVSAGESVTDIEFPDYHSITVNHAGKTWRSSTLLYLPYLVFQLQRVLAFPRRLTLPSEEKLKKISSRKIGGASAVCAAFAEKNERKRHQFCFDPTTGSLIQESEPTWLTTYDFGGFAPFGTRSFPRTLSVLQNGQLIIDVKVMSITPHPKINGDALVLPPGIQATAIPHCATDPAQLTKAIFQPAPHYPREGKMKRISGTVVIYADIGKDGVPRGLTILASPGEGFTQSSLATVSQWRYQPPACNGVPMDAFSAIEVHYTLSE